MRRLMSGPGTPVVALSPISVPPAWPNKVAAALSLASRDDPGRAMPDVQEGGSLAGKESARTLSTFISASSLRRLPVVVAFLRASAAFLRASAERR